MRITRNTGDTAAGPSDWFTGAVYIDTVTTPTEPSRLAAASVHFTPGARTAWHTRIRSGRRSTSPRGSGSASVAADRSRSSAPATVCSSSPTRITGHGAAATRFMTHIAMQEADDEGSPVTWGEHVSDDEYAAAPPIDGWPGPRTLT